jgi:hypothetical protein
MVGNTLLRRNVHFIKANVVRAYGEWEGEEAGREATEVRDPKLDHKAATGVEVSSSVTKARDLLCLCGQV